jgi:hypothetical protein
MQLIILVYHITGASKDIGIYMMMRLFVSSYLFLNGFGHFSFYWKEKEKEERKKVVQVEENGLPSTGKPDINNHGRIIRFVSVRVIQKLRDILGGRGVVILSHKLVMLLETLYIVFFSVAVSSIRYFLTC